MRKEVRFSDLAGGNGKKKKAKKLTKRVEVKPNPVLIARQEIISAKKQMLKEEKQFLSGEPSGTVGRRKNLGIKG